MAFICRICLGIMTIAIYTECYAFNSSQMEKIMLERIPPAIEQIPGSPQKTIVVYPLSAYTTAGKLCNLEKDSAPNHAANIIPLFIENALVGRMQVLERRQIDKVLKELKLQFSDLFDYDAARKVGKFMNADYIIVGEGVYTFCYSDSPNLIRIKFVEIETGVVRTGLLLQ